MNFRKHIGLFLTFFLLVSTLGLAFNVHYCDNEIASVSINTASNSQEIEKNCCGKIEKMSKCCKNKIIKTILFCFLANGRRLFLEIFSTSNQEKLLLITAMRMHRHYTSCTANILFTPDLIVIHVRFSILYENQNLYE